MYQLTIKICLKKWNILSIVKANGIFNYVPAPSDIYHSDKHSLTVTKYENVSLDLKA